METRRKKEVSEVIGGLGISALKYADHLKELVNKIVNEHPEVNPDDVRIFKDESGYVSLFYDRYMTDEELEEINARLKKLQEEVELSGLLDE